MPDLNSVSVVRSSQLPIYVSCIGDSISANSPSGCWFESSIINSKGFLRKVVNASVGGDTCLNMIARFDADIKPYPSDEIWIQAGTNDMTSGNTEDILTYKNDLSALIDKAKLTGRVIRLFSTPPRNSQPTTANNFRVIQSIVAIEKKVHYLDIWSEAFDPSNGLFVSGGAVDGIHPACALATKATASILKSLSVSGEICQYLPMQNTAYIGLNSNPLLLIDTDLDGVADPFFGGNGAFSISATTYGNKQNVVASNATPTSLSFPIYGVTGINKYRFVARVKSTMNNSYFSMFVTFKNGVSTIGSKTIVVTRSNLDGIIFEDFENIPNTTSFTIGLTLTPITGNNNSSFSLEQVQVFNLTSLGVV